MAGLEQMKNSIEIDLKHIRKELAEQEMIPGAYCQEYETFKIIYRFVERRMRRTKESAYIILLTLTDGAGEFPELRDRDERMELLSGLIQGSIRAGDVYTKYSSCQFLLMALDLSERDTEVIVKRIADAFYRSVGEESGLVLLDHCFSMRAAGK